MGRKVYVGNLSFSVNDSALEGLFGTFGTVDSAKVIIDRDSGRSKGFGFVEMSADSEAAEAIGKLNDTEFEGRTITVNEARPQKPRSGGGFGGGGGGGGGGGRGGRGRY